MICDHCKKLTNVRVECLRCKRRVCEKCYDFREDRCRIRCTTTPSAPTDGADPTTLESS
jgi:hypothetical protein